MIRSPTSNGRSMRGLAGRGTGTPHPAAVARLPNLPGLARKEGARFEVPVRRGHAPLARGHSSCGASSSRAGTTLLLLMPPAWLVLDPHAFFPGSRRDPRFYLGYVLFLPEHLFASSRTSTMLVGCRPSFPGSCFTCPFLPLPPTWFFTSWWPGRRFWRNYVDGFGIAYSLLALLAVSRARADRPWAGFASAGSVVRPGGWRRLRRREAASEADSRFESYKVAAAFEGNDSRRQHGLPLPGGLEL